MPNALMTAGPGSFYQRSKHKEDSAGFWSGLWHGLITPITFIVSLFDPNVRIYETKNTGRWYDLGFVIGISASFGGSSQAGTRM